MYEVNLKTRNSMPFSELSKKFPGLLIYRWCNSAVDYLEFYGRQYEIDQIRAVLPEFVESLNTNIVSESHAKGRLSVMVSCRCSTHNSAIRILESKNCLWQAPVIYRGGYERINAVAFNESDLQELFESLSSIGEVSLERKTRLEPESLHDVYLIPISSLLGKMTEKQLGILREAIRKGYFSTPRKTSVEELAEGEGISESTMQEHMSKGINKLLSSMEPYINLMLEYRKNLMEEHGGE